MSNEFDLLSVTYKNSKLDIYRPCYIMWKRRKSTSRDWTDLAEARVGRTCYDEKIMISNNPTASVRGDSPLCFLLLKIPMLWQHFTTRPTESTSKHGMPLYKGLSQHWKQGTHSLQAFTFFSKRDLFSLYGIELGHLTQYSLFLWCLLISNSLETVIPFCIAILFSNQFWL